MMSRSGAEAQIGAVRQAVEVCDSLGLAGLPAFFAGSSFDGLAGRGHGGAVVYYDPSPDDLFGVYVFWQNSPAVAEIIRRDLAAGAPLSADDLQRISVMASFTSAMHDALERVLSAQGWHVARQDAGGSEVLRVDGERDGA